MRQHITKQQWGDITHEEKKEVCNKLDWGNPPFTDTLTIGELIEFLGDDLDEIWLKDGIAWRVRLNNKDEWFRDEELIDTLLEAVKYKLRNTIT